MNFTTGPGCWRAALATLFLFAPNIAFATDYYVDVNSPYGGNTSGFGLSPSAPFHDIWTAVHVLKPGDTAHVAPGAYITSTSGDNIYIDISGASKQPITFLGDPTSLPQIWTTASTFAVQFADNVSNVVFENFDVQAKGGGGGIWLSNGANHITIANSIVHDCDSAGIGGAQNDYVTVSGNTVYDNAWNSDQDPSGIDLLWLTNTDTLTGYHNIIEDNIVYNNANKTNLAGKPYTTDGNGIIIDDSRHTQNNSLGPAYTGSTLIVNNVVFNNGGRGIHVYDSDNVMIVNNTVYYNNLDTNNDNYNDAGQIESYSAGTVSVYNNIMDGPAINNNSQVSFSAQETTTGLIYADYNLTYGSTSSHDFKNSLHQIWGNHNRAGDPLFADASTDPNSANFQVFTGSPALGLGTEKYAPSTDILGNPRPAIGGVTAGAYQDPVAP